MCSRCLLSGLLPHLPQQVGGDANHIDQVDRRTNMRQPSRSQLREETYQSMRSRLLELIGEEESGQPDAQILETFHKCETNLKNQKSNTNINALLSDICEPATEPATGSSTAESSEMNNRGVTRKKRSLSARGRNKLSRDPFLSQC